MRASVQLGLLCLSLLIYSLDGKEIDAEISKEQPPNFAWDVEDLPQFQVSENEPKQNYLSHDPDIIPANFRVKRQENGKSTKRKRPRPGSVTLLGTPQQVKLPSTRVRRQTDKAGKKKPNKHGRSKPGKFSLLAKPPSQVTRSSGKLATS